ncbi:glutamate-ammonia-ligase adenylyltransferase glnE [Mycobacterium tuberculosis '98-R604 INH-RIF-EM']|nr:glutamate-ammonia-ligase adenylyltransferase glnE [Mycobacterium tuberculosis '98-R604 INH-RIF-EM']
MVVTKLATQRPKLPSVGRLGLVDPPAGERLAQLGWDRHEDQAHVDLLWSLSRAPDADAALRALIRLSENPDTGWDELNAALLRERSLRGRLFSVLGSSLALGDHLVAHPQSWKLLRGKVTLPSHDQLQRSFVECVEESEGMPGSLVHRLRTQYRDYVLMLAALDLAATVEDEPVLPFTVVAARLADAADAALAAALRVAEASVCGEHPPPRLAVIAMGKCGARELNYVSDVDVIFVAERSDPRNARVASEMMRVASAAFFEVDAALRPEGRNGELVRTLRVAHRLTTSAEQDLGVSGVAESTASRWRRGTWRALPDRLDADGVASLRARRLCGRGAGHAAAGGAAGARRCPRPRAQTRQRRIARRGVRRTATAAGSCP